VLPIGATAGDTLVVVAYGAFNVANTYTQAQADARYPLNTSSFFAGKNKIINGDMSIWQRGTSFTQPTGAAFGYSGADRWVDARNGGGTVTISRQSFTPGTAPVVGYEGKFFYRYAQSVAGSGQTYSVIGQRIEDVQTLAGQTATISFWAKADASRTVTSTFNQNFGSGGSGSTSTTVGTFNLTTSWTRFTSTISVPTITGNTIGTSSFAELQFNFPLNAVFTIDLWGVQVEAGTVATAFQTATGTIQGELAACQRYFFVGGNAAAGVCNSGSTARFSLIFPVTMRVAPTITAIAAPQALNPGVAETQTGSQTTDFQATASGGLANTVAASKVQFGGFSSMADGRASVLLNNALSFSAEL
jgi:hypothetical protein